MSIDAPFPWFGGKSRVADVVWERFGDVPNYVEPFFGSGAVLLGRPDWHKGRTETVNDKDGFVANFWRAVQHDPEQVAFYADNPVNENDLHARHSWLVGQRDDLTARLEGDPEFYDPKIAGWWVWGICCWIGSGWCSGEGPWHVEDGRLVNVKGDAGRGVNRKLVHLGNAGQGVNRQLVNLRNAGQGVNRKLVHLGDAGQGVNRKLDSGLVGWFTALADRLRDVRVCSGDWGRVCGPSPTFRHGMTAVFLDPPYDQYEALYHIEDTVSAAVREWAIEAGKNPLMRVELCGYEGEHAMPGDWEVYAWKAHGGYANQASDDDSAGKLNAHLERIWFSPACLKPSTQGVLL